MYIYAQLHTTHTPHDSHANNNTDVQKHTHGSSAGSITHIQVPMTTNEPHIVIHFPSPPTLIVVIPTLIISLFVLYSSSPLISAAHISQPKASTLNISKVQITAKSTQWSTSHSIAYTCTPILAQSHLHMHTHTHTCNTHRMQQHTTGLFVVKHTQQHTQQQRQHRAHRTAPCAYRIITSTTHATPTCTHY